MVRMSPNGESPRRDCGDSSQLTNCILDSGSNCCMTPKISDFIPGSLVEIDKYIKVVYVYFVKEKKQEKFKYKYMTIIEKPSFLCLRQY